MQKETKMEQMFRYFGNMKVPELEGTEKQVLWAAKIIAEKVNAFGAILEKNEKAVLNADLSRQEKERLLEQCEEGVKSFKRAFPTYTNASWWINKRNEDVKKIAVMIAKQGMDMDEMILS